MINFNTQGVKKRAQINRLASNGALLPSLVGDKSVMSATLPVVASTQEVIGTTVPAISAVLLGT